MPLLSTRPSGGEHMTRLLSVVVPCFNEQDVIGETHQQLFSMLEQICARKGMDFEILYVNDGSRDGTLSMLQLIHSTCQKVKVVCLSRNFGHQIALTAGLSKAKGDAVVAIDADLQDPPAVIEEMVDLYLQGCDVSYFKLATAKVFYIVVRKLTRIDIPLDTGDFRLMSRRALDAFLAMPEKHRFVRGMIPWIGFRQQAVLYDRAKRFAGVTKYPFSKMMRLALDGITSFSNAPLQSAYLLGFFVAGLCLLLAVLIAFRQLVFGFPVQGWSSIMVCVLFVGAVQLITVGILGEYIGRIYDEVKARPLFLIDEENSR
jgi:polyisoprenyl-phosphate glycosyltransferase